MARIISASPDQAVQVDVNWQDLVKLNMSSMHWGLLTSRENIIVGCN